MAPVKDKNGIRENFAFFFVRGKWVFRNKGILIYNYILVIYLNYYIFF